MWDYTDKVKDLYTNPKNVGKIEDADGVGKVGSVVCGDSLTLYIKVKDNIITDAKFETYGCGSAIASSSALTEMIKGKTVEEAEAVTNEDIIKFLGGLPNQKIHCSVMGSEALENAIADYRGEIPPVEDEPEGDIICHCMNVTDVDIRKAIHEKGIKDLDGIIEYTKAGSACGGCIPRIEDILEDELGNKSEEEGNQPLTNIQRMHKIEDTIEKYIRPALHRDGGDIELVDIDNKKVSLKFKGACSSCMGAKFTFEKVVVEELKKHVEEDIEVKLI